MKGKRARGGDFLLPRLVLPVFQETKTVEARLVGPALARMARRAMAEKGFRGEVGETLVLFAPDAGRVGSLVLLGLGHEGKCTLETLRRAFGGQARRSRKEGVREVALFLKAPPLAKTLGALGLIESAEAIRLAWALGSYVYDAYKTGGEKRRPTRLAIRLDSLGASRKQVTAAIRRAEVVAEAVNLVRDLANTPANDLYPEKLAEHATRLGRERRLTVRVLRKADLVRQRMGGILGVAKGSDRPPCLITIDYRPPNARATLALVGKAITFDSGGLSIKPAKGMEEMKFDMSGGGAVLGALAAISRLKPPIRVIGIIPSAENLIGGSAMRPGDILTSASGKTIEVVNTDAEGRLILADGLHYASRYRPDYVLDFATLTGACLVALGTTVSGLVANDKDLARMVFEAGERSGERVWELPLYEEFIEATKSQVADLKNSAGRNGGAITAAAFLSHFVGRTRWCHLDIAGTAWTDRDTGPFTVGATGVGVRLVIALVEALTSKKKAPRKG